MENFNLELHQIHCEDFFDFFYSALELRETIKEKIEYFSFIITIEEQRINRYLVELKPDLYLDHRIYVNDIKSIITRLLTEKEVLKKSLNKNKIITYKWIIEDEKLVLLFEKLKDNFISSETSLDVFKFLFSGKPLKEVSRKIEWLKYSNKTFLNKKSITDLIDVLGKFKTISNPNLIKKVDAITILNTLFSSKNDDLKFNTANFVTPTKKSQHRGELEDIINSIHNLPPQQSKV